jgi:NADH-quinone oxidoreductase subunit L
MNRLGDVGVTLGILSLYFAFKSLDFDLIFALVPFFFNKKITFIGIRIDYLTITTLFLFVGVVAKSAQLGLHT